MPEAGYGMAKERLEATVTAALTARAAQCHGNPRALTRDSRHKGNEQSPKQNVMD